MGKARIAERRERPIKIHKLEGRQRYQVGIVQAFDLPDAIRRWFNMEERGFTDAHFQANTVTVRTFQGADATYVATD